MLVLTPFFYCFFSYLLPIFLDLVYKYFLTCKPYSCSSTQLQEKDNLNQATNPNQYPLKISC